MAEDEKESGGASGDEQQFEGELEDGDPGDIGTDLMFKNRDPEEPEFRIPLEPGDPGDIGVEEVREGRGGKDD